ncbi:MAG: DUF1385 domain-containing protein [Clostridia bacterium]
MKKTTIGGQALIEGIIMHGPDSSCIVVRKPDQTLDILEKPRKKRPNAFLKLPFIRGCASLFRSLKEGMDALTYSANLSGEDEELSKFEKWLINKFGNEKVEKAVMGVSIVLAVIVSVGLFILLPTLIAGFASDFVESSILRNLIEGAVRIVIFLAYMYVISISKDIKRTYMYHGAEHKTISCYERELELTVENAREMPKEHPRCGTSFLFVVMIISILVFSVFTWSNPLARVVLRIVMIPVVVGISYEFNRLVGKFDNKFTYILRFPGIKLQGLTTIEPDDSMLEVAIEALKRVLPENQGSDNW